METTAMTPLSIEKRIRAGFPILRLMQAYLPLSVAKWLNQQSVKRVRLGPDVEHEAVFADGVPCVWIIPDDCPKDKVLLYLHGGGFVYGLTSLHMEMVAYLAKKMGMRSLMVDYRLGPKYPFPAALDDCVSAYCWLLKQGISAQQIGIAGDSAGGNLTLTTMMKLQSDGLPLPAAAACLSPVADLTDRDSRSKSNDPLLHPRAVKIYHRSYLADNDAHNPFISPVFGDWHGLPPLLVHAGEDEILRQDALRIAELAKAAGVEVRLEIYPRMWHVWQIFMGLPQATQSLDDIAQFLTTYIHS